MKLKFELSLDDANKVINALGHRPYVEVAGVVSTLQQQAAPQIAAQEKRDAKLAKAAKSGPVAS